MTTDAFKQSFAAFARDKLRPAMERIPAGKRRCLLVAVGAALAVFVVLAAVAFLVLRPYQEIMREHTNVNPWPLMLMAPVSLAVIVFALVYILGPRTMVREFHASLLARVAEFIDPGLVHEANATVDAAALGDSLLFDGLGAARAAGADRFRGRSGAAAVELRDVRVAAAGGGGDMLTGVFLRADMDKAFREPLFVFPQTVEASRSGLERALTERGVVVTGGLVRIDDKITLRQVVKPAEAHGWGDGFLPRGVGDALADLRREDGTELYLSCRDRVLYAALLSRSGKTESADAADSFDFGNCLTFCRRGGVAVQLAREVSQSPGLWQE